MITYERLAQIIPSDQALAWKALSASFAQLNNIQFSQAQNIGNAYVQIETNKDLPDINNATQVLSNAAIAYYQNTLATGTGVDGTIVLYDILGTAAGNVHTDAFLTCASTINTMNTEGDLTYLGNIYTTMLSTVDGTFGDPIIGPVTIPGGYPGAGIYASADDAFGNALISNAQIELANIVSANPTQTTTLNTEFNAIADKLVSESNYIADASVDFANQLPNSKASIQGLIMTLDTNGTNTEVGGTVAFLENVADLSIIGGQAIVACLREGRNRAVLNAERIGQFNQVSADLGTEPPQANLLPSTYTVSEAANTIIT